MLPSQDSLRGGISYKPLISPVQKNGRKSTLASQSKRRRKQTPSKTAPNMVVKSPGKNFIMGEVKILKRGETIDDTTKAELRSENKTVEAGEKFKFEERKSDAHSKSLSRLDTQKFPENNRAGGSKYMYSITPLMRETKMISKEKLFVNVKKSKSKYFAGSVIPSPPPSSLPVPEFLRASSKARASL